MTNNKIQSLVAVQAIKDFLLIEFVDEADTKMKCVVGIIKELRVDQGEKLELKKIDNVLFDNKFIEFITEMDYALDLEFEPVKSVFYGLTKQ